MYWLFCIFLPGFASSHWVISVSAEYGIIEYSGLWEKCADLSIGYHNYECEGFVWEDFQVSREFFIFVAYSEENINKQRKLVLMWYVS